MKILFNGKDDYSFFPKKPNTVNPIIWRKKIHVFHEIKKGSAKLLSMHIECGEHSLNPQPLTQAKVSELIIPPCIVLYFVGI